MGTPAAPRLDPRLLQYIAGARLGSPAAEVTRAVGDLAWTLDKPRPSYEQVRLLLRRRVELVLTRVLALRRLRLSWQLLPWLQRAPHALLALAKAVEAAVRRAAGWAVRIFGFS